MLWHQLALQLGGRTVAELQRTMSSAEFVRWKAYYKLEPGEPYRTDLRFATLMALIANMVRGKKQKARTPKEFMLFSNRKHRIRRAETVEEKWALWKTIKAVFGKRGT